MKKLSTLLIVLMFFVVSTGNAISNEASFNNSVEPSNRRACIGISMVIFGNFVSANFCCTYNYSGTNVTCGFEREMNPNEVFQGKLILEEWGTIIEEYGLRAKSSALNTVSVEIKDDTSVGFMETDSYVVYLLAGTYRVDMDGAVSCNFRKVLKH